MKQPPFPTKDNVVQGWIDSCRAEHGSKDSRESFWVHMFMTELYEKFPEETFDVIKRVLEQEDDPRVVGMTAAGPIEQLLVDHGFEMIDAYEAEARSNEKFKHALGGAWLSSVPVEIRKRIEAVRDSVW